MNTVETLRKAAEKLRTLAGQATPGPWCYYSDDLWRGSVAPLEAFDAAMDEEVAPWPYDDATGHLFAGDPVRPADAEYIAAMHPGIGLALAKTLALDADALEMALGLGEYDPGTGYDDELAIARLILERTS